VIDLHYVFIKQVFKTTSFPSKWDPSQSIEIANEVKYEPNGSKMSQWFADLLETQLNFMYREFFFSSFVEGGWSTFYSGFKNKSYKTSDQKTMDDDIADYNSRGMLIYSLQEVDDAIDVLIFKYEDIENMRKIIEVVKIITKGTGVVIKFREL